MITVQKNLEMDIDLFKGFFFKGERVQHKAMILRGFSDLKGIKRQKDMDRYVRHIYSKYKQRIDAVIGDLEKKVDSLDPKIWERVEALLNEKFNKQYFLYPTMLPFSPYGQNYFNFSIFPYVFSKHQVSKWKILGTSSHELIHLLFYKKMQRLYKADSWDKLPDKMGLSSWAFDGLKEIYAPVIQNHCSMKKYFPNRIIGNNEYSAIKVAYKGHVMSVEDYFIERYGELEKRFSGRDRIDMEMVKFTRGIDKEFSKRLKIYNTVHEAFFAREGLYNPIFISAR